MMERKLSEEQVERYAVGDFGDARLNKVGAELHARMIEEQKVCLRQLSDSRAGEVRFGRFLANECVDKDRLVAGVCEGIGVRSMGRHTLVIEDSSEVNFQKHAKRVSGLGTVGNGVDVGFFIHPALVIDAADGACLGLAHVHLWERWEGKHPNYRSQPIESKESFRWISTIEAAKKRLPDAGMITVVADREADIYELLDRMPDARTHVLVRASRDRALATNSGQGLFDLISAQPIRDSYRLKLNAIPGKRTAHEALLHVRFTAITLKKPLHCSDKNAAPTLTLNVIEVIEDATTVIGNEEPIHWRLLTTHAVATKEEARQCIRWYCQRWYIEQTFRILKRQGLNLESSLVEHGERLEKLAIVAISAAVRTLQLTLAREGNTERPATDAFSDDEIEVLAQIQPKLEGKTEKLRNPHPPYSLAWAAWSIARLGGWKGYASERKPGPITMLHGLQTFSSLLLGWHWAHELDG